MNIGFYGHSICTAIDTPNDESFIDQIRKKYSANIVNIGVPQGSEERILFDLKKTKNLDFAIIFHSFPKYIFLPKCNRDVSINTVPSKKSTYFWSERNSDPVSEEEFKEIFFSYGGIREVFENPDNYITSMTHYKEYFYHPDLMTNRFQANLLLIDNYLFNNNIPSFHAIHPKVKPNWMHFQSGVVNLIFLLFPYFTYYNNITQDQNNYIANILKKWIDNQLNVN